MAGRYTEYLPEGEETVMADPDRIDMHDLLERIKNMDSEIIRIQANRAEALELYRHERDKLDAHYEMVINKTMADPGPTTGRY